MRCQHCDGETKRFGKDRKGNQRFRCLSCGKTAIAPYEKPLDDMRLPLDKALMALQLLVEGNSIRSTERITGIGKTAITSLLLLAGEKCERLMEKRIRKVKVSDVQADDAVNVNVISELRQQLEKLDVPRVRLGVEHHSFCHLT